MQSILRVPLSVDFLLDYTVRIGARMLQNCFSLYLLISFSDQRCSLQQGKSEVKFPVVYFSVYLGWWVRRKGSKMKCFFQVFWQEIQASTIIFATVDQTTNIFVSGLNEKLISIVMTNNFFHRAKEELNSKLMQKGNWKLKYKSCKIE